MKIFLGITSLSPAFGGPAFSIARLALALAEEGIDVGLWAPDQSASNTSLLPSHAPVSRLTGSADHALDDFSQVDIIHDNGIWLPHNHRLAGLAARRGIPRIVSTRGALEPWAFRHKAWKKRIAWALYQRRDMAHSDCFHTTAETETKNLKRFGFKIPVCMIPDGVDVPEGNRNSNVLQRTTSDEGHVKTALFLGRIYPVKGLPMLVQAWALLRPHGWRLQIAGPDEAGHRAEVEKAVKEAGLEKEISFIGAIQGEAKQSAYFNADLFILPTHSESFGMVIAEALAHGVPVLTTSGAPWPQLSERGCGWSVEPTIEGVADGLRRATAHDAPTLQAMGSKGRDWVAAEYTWSGIARQFIAAYESLLANGRGARIHSR